MTLMLLLTMIFLLVAQMGCETCNRSNPLLSVYELYYIHCYVHQDCCRVDRRTFLAKIVICRFVIKILMLIMLMMRIIITTKRIATLTLANTSREEYAVCAEQSKLSRP